MKRTLLLFLAAAVCAFSQINNASLSGLVNDASQGVISGVTVTVKTYCH